MFEKFANFIVKRRWYVILFWVIMAILIGIISPSLSSVTSDDQASFLPSKYESAQAQQIAKEYFPQSEGTSVLALIKSKDGQPLSSAQRQEIQSIANTIDDQKIEHVSIVATSPEMLSANKKAQLITAQVVGNPQDEALLDSVKELRSSLAELTKDSTLSYGVTGSLAIMLDTVDSSSNAEKIVGIITVLLILILPTIVFRSPFVGLLSLISVSIVFFMTSSLLALTAKIFDFNVSGQLTSILIVVLFGIGTDYILFLLFRYRERLRNHSDSKGAVAFAISRAGEAVLSAALVVASAFAALFIASLGFFSSIAPGLVMAVILMLFASLTLVPAMLSMVGEKIFWPSKKWKTEKTGKLAKKLSSAIANHPWRTSTISLFILLFMVVGLTQYKASFDIISQLPSNTESSKTFKELGESFPAGTSSPALVYVKSNEALSQDSINKLLSTLSEAKGVASILPVMPTGHSPSDQQQAPQFAQISPNGKAAIVSLILSDDPTSDQAMENIAGPIREATHSTGLNAQIAVGGETATYVDLKSATDSDLEAIVPLAAGIIFIILVILLRSLVAPIYLLFTVALGVLATLGATSYVFITLSHGSGLIFMLPILMYLFVVAVGTDYNILMITRLREELFIEKNSQKTATKKAVEHSFTTLVSAGVILAGTFASLMLAGLSLLTQMGFSVTLGISLGAFLISLILIPALTTIFGKWVWWPSSHKPKK